MVVVHQPFERRASVDDVAVCIRRDAGQLHAVVHDQGVAHVLVREAHAAFAQPEVAWLKRAAQGGHDFERMFREVRVLIPQVQLGQRGARVREGAEVGGEGNARQALGEIVGEALAIVRRVQDAVDVVEDGVLGDGGIGVSDAEALEGRVRDVVDALQCPLLREEVRVVKDTPLDGSRPTLGSTGRKRGSGGRAFVRRRGRRMASWSRFQGRR